jgi:hypothetical protein
MKTKALIVTVMIAISGITSSAFAQTRFDASHPRRAEVNGRLANQDRRIHNEVREGEMSHRQADRLHRDDRSIRHEERYMAGRDHGHLTRRDDARLNHRENRVSHRIGR